jgi:calcineurin-like phosphoesterase family protein
MEVEVKHGPGKVKIAVYSIAAFFIRILIYYSVMAIISPSVKISAINREFGYIAPEKGAIDERFFTDSAFVQLNRNKAFAQARIIMAETDSICLAINLSDSIAILEINGVAVHKAKLSYIRLSKVLIKADEYAVTNMLSSPFTVSKDFATIRKEPVMIKIAPKDTSEYKPDILPDTARIEDVNYMLEMENGIRLYVYQQNDEEGGGLRKYFFDVNDRFKNIAAIFRKILVFKVPEHHPAIRIKMERADARIIYRALPRHGQMALYR